MVIMFCGISGLLGGLFVVGVSFNSLMTASPCGELVDVPCGTVIALGVLAAGAFLVVFLVVLANPRFDFGLAIILISFIKMVNHL
jgi:hypothetical protein